MLNRAALTAETLASVFEQSVDCVKLVDLDGAIRWMNANGLCAMEIDDFSGISGKQWADLWPEDSRSVVAASMPAARLGETVRFNALPHRQGNAALVERDRFARQRHRWRRRLWDKPTQSPWYWVSSRSIPPSTAP